MPVHFFFIRWVISSHKVLVPDVGLWGKIGGIQSVSKVIEHEPGEVVDMNNIIGSCSCNQSCVSG